MSAEGDTKQKLPKEAYNRFFENKLSDWDKTKEKEGSDEKLNKQIEGEIDALVKEVKEQYSKDKTAKEGNIYVGAGGVSWTWLRLYSVRSDKAFLTEGLEYLKQMEKLMSETEGPSLLTGVGGLYVLQAAYAHTTKDKDGVSKAVEKLKALREKALSAKGNDLAGGRAGYLYAVSWLNKYLGDNDTIPASWCKPVIEAIFEDGQAEGKKHGHSPLMWSWDGKRQIGAAHGLMGIIHTLFHFPLTAEQNKLAWGTLEYLINDPQDSVRFASGNYAKVDGDASNPDNDYLIHWCHGAPGMISLLTKAYQMIEDKTAPEKTSLTKDKILSEIEKTQQLIWQRGLLKRGIGLCHGIDGNAYCFLHLYRIFKDQKYLHRANAFATFAIENWRTLTKEKQMDEPDHRCSLMEGLGGAIYFYLELTDPKTAHFPGYELWGPKKETSKL